MRRPGDSEPKDDTMQTLRNLARELEKNTQIQTKEFLRSRIQNGKTGGNETGKTAITRPNEYENMPAKS